MIGFAEEEGQRYAATFLGSGALVGDFKPEWLDQRDAQGTTMREAMQHAGLCIDDIPTLRRDPARYLGFVEVHIEQGPVLFEMGLPLGVVTSINGSVRYRGRIVGMASHAGTTPWTAGDAAAATAELALYLERRAARDGDSVGTMGMLDVPNGSINVVPGECRFSLTCARPATPSATRWRPTCWPSWPPSASAGACAANWKRPCAPPPRQRAGLAGALGTRGRGAGLPVHRMPSGAGHDAMKLHEAMPQAMLFVRGQNFGISHNPLESTTANDMQLAAQALRHLLDALAHEMTR